MAESALRYLDQMYMMGIGQGPAAPRPQRTRGQEYADMLGAASLPLSGVPIAGDIAGFAADAAMYAAYPEERTMGNYAMSALGGLPLIPGAAALRAARSDPIDMPSISAGSKINLNPNKLTFREADQNRIEQAAELFDSGEEINPIVTIYNNGRRDILDGHNRAAVAISRRQNLPAVDIDIKEYERLKEAGFDDMEITYATLLRANEDDAASAISNQFYGAGIRQRGTEALSLMDDPAAVVPAPSPLEGTLDMSTEARMQRAAEQGFDKRVFYHGGSSVFDEFFNGRRGNYFTDDPKIADIYAGNAQRRWPKANNASPNVMPVMLRGRPLVVSDQREGSGGWYSDNLADALSVDLRKIPVAKRGQALREEARDQGYGFLEIRDMDDLGGRQTQFIALDPSNIRSVNAAFDPVNRGSANILATAAGGTIGLSALRQLMPQEEERPIE